MKIKKITILLAMALLISSAIRSQDNKHEVFFSATGGISSLKYKINEGDNKLAFGSSVGVGYNYFLSENWALNTGLELSFMNSKGLMDNISDEYNAIDANNDEFRFAYSIHSVEEKQNATFLNIPLMVQFQQSVSKGFYAAVGGKIGIPVSGKYTTTLSDLSTTAYYADIDLLIDKDNEVNGIGHFAGAEKKADLDMKLSFMLSAEVGNKWRLTDKLALYSGVYCDYGLNDVRKNKEKGSLLGYNKQHPSDFEVNSITASKYLKAEGTKALTEKMYPISIGVKLKLAFAY